MTNPLLFMGLCLVSVLCNLLAKKMLPKSSKEQHQFFKSRSAKAWTVLVLLVIQVVTGVAVGGMIVYYIIHTLIICPPEDRAVLIVMTLVAILVVYLACKANSDGDKTE